MRSFSRSGTARLGVVAACVLFAIVTACSDMLLDSGEHADDVEAVAEERVVADEVLLPLGSCPFCAGNSVRNRRSTQWIASSFLPAGPHLYMTSGSRSASMA